MMVLQHNMASMFTQRELKVITGQRAKTTEKLSSGYRINRAADDAAGLTISEKMRSLVRGLNKASENVQDGISFLQVGEGALNEIHDMLHRITELAIKSANGTNTDQDRESIDEEVQQIKKEMSRIYNSTEFNTLAIFKAPYTPDIEGMPNDFELFNGPDGRSVAGVLINHKRYTWGELGAPESPLDHNWVKDITDPDNPDELIRLQINAGDTCAGIHRVYIMEADDTGININNLRSGTWDGTITQSGDTYSWTYRGMNLSFEAESGDTRADIVSKLNGDGISVNSWDAIPAGGSSKYAATSSRDTLTINVTNDNKNTLDGWEYRIVADDTGVGLVQTSGSDGLTHTRTKWEDFSNTLGGQPFPISDWGVADEGSNPVTLDSSARYKYTDGASAGYLTNGLSFTFEFPTSEVSKSQAISALTQNLNGSSISAPIQSVTAGSGAAVSSYSFSFNFQRDYLLRDFGSNGSSSPMSLSVDRTMVNDGTVTDHELRKTLSEAYVRQNVTIATSTVTRYNSIVSTAFYDENGNLLDAAPEGASYDASSPADKESAQTVTHSANYISNTGLDPDWTDHSDSTGSYSSAGVEFFVRAMTYTDGGVTKTGTVRIEFDTSEAVRTVTDRSYQKSGGRLANYVSNGGSYSQVSSSDYYVMATGDDLPKDTDGNTYRAATGSDTGQRYVQTSQAWIATKTYDLDHYTYSAKNSGGTEVLSKTSGNPQFLITNDSATSITIHDASGNVHTYETENSSAVRSATLSGNRGSLRLDYTAGTGDRSNSVTVTPAGNASRTFTKNARSAGSSSDTNLTVKVNPPKKLLIIQAGALEGHTIDLEWPALSNSIVGISGAKVNSVETSLASIGMLEDALDFISGVRSSFGAMQNRLEAAYRINRNTEENTQAAESLIRDADMAKEMVSHSRNEILTSAAMAMLSQANAQPQSILSLLS